MATVTRLTRQQVETAIRQRFFRIADDNTLVYQDPLFGRLRRTNLHISINWQRYRLEMVVSRHVARVFELAPSPALACEAAFLAYVRFIERDARQTRAVA